MSRTSTIFPGYIPEGYFGEENVEFVRAKVGELLKREYVQFINIDKASVLRIMQRVLEERLEPVPKMNQRVIMYLANEFRTYQMDLKKKMKWEDHYIESQRLYDSTTERGPDLQNIKLAQCRRPSPGSKNYAVGGTVKFVFI
jgi:hypothetical protein